MGRMEGGGFLLLQRDYRLGFIYKSTQFTHGLILASVFDGGGGDAVVRPSGAGCGEGLNKLA